LRYSGLWRRIVLWQDTNVSEVRVASIFTSHWRWRQHGPLKRWYPTYPTTTLYGFTTQKTSAWIFTAVKTSNLFVICTLQLFRKPMIVRTLSKISWEELNSAYFPSNGEAERNCKLIYVCVYIYDLLLLVGLQIPTTLKSLIQSQKFRIVAISVTLKT
jgi:hypothetical protein